MNSIHGYIWSIWIEKYFILQIKPAQIWQGTGWQGGLLLQVTFTLIRSTEHQSSNRDTQVNFTPSVLRKILLRFSSPTFQVASSACGLHWDFSQGGDRIHSTQEKTPQTSKICQPFSTSWRSGKSTQAISSSKNLLVDASAVARLSCVFKRWHW